MMAKYSLGRDEFCSFDCRKPCTGCDGYGWVSTEPSEDGMVETWRCEFCNGVGVELKLKLKTELESLPWKLGEIEYE